MTPRSDKIKNTRLRLHFTPMDHSEGAPCPSGPIDADLASRRNLHFTGLFGGYELICRLSLSTELSLSPLVPYLAATLAAVECLRRWCTAKPKRPSFIWTKTSRRNNTHKKPRRPLLPLDMNSANASYQRKLSRACVHLFFARLCEQFSYVYRSYSFFLCRCTCYRVF